MAENRFVEFLKNALRYAESALLKVYFWIGQWVLYFAILVSAVIVLEMLTFSDPNFYVLTNAVGAIAALIALIIAIVIHVPIGLIALIFGNTTSIDRAMTLVAASGLAFVGHFFATMIDIIFQPLFSMLNFINTIADYILVPDATQRLDTGRVVPAACEFYSDPDGKTYRFPKYVIGDIVGVSPVINSFTDLFENEFQVCIGSACIDFAVKDIPGFSAAYNGLVNLRDKPLFPMELLLNISSTIENFLSTIFPEVSGTDVLKHYVFIHRLEFNAQNQLVEGQGSAPFSNFLSEKLEGIFGCNFVN